AGGGDEISSRDEGELAPRDGDADSTHGDSDSTRDVLRQAAVALVLRRRLSEAELLIIKRSESERDHWSGHLALPGGRMEPEDAGLLATAVRETFEEVGLKLDEGGEVIGRLATVVPQSRLVPRIAVTPFVAVAPAEYHVFGEGETPTVLTLSSEVAAAFWVPVSEFASGGRAADPWQAKLDAAVRFYQTTEVGVLVVGTEKSLYGLDSETGDVLWRRKGARLDETDVASVPGTDLLLITLERGDKTRLEAADLLTGDALWRSDKVGGAVVQP